MFWEQPDLSDVVRLRPTTRTTTGDAEPLHTLRDAVTERAASERRIAQAVTAAREAGVSWSAIGGMLGTSGEAARKRYSVSTETA